jgi:hypothetical protein
MKLGSMFASGLALLTVGGMTLAPVTASASDRHHRHEGNEWRDLAIGAGIVGTIGLLSHNDTLAVAGGAGLLYSAYRADEECGSDGRWFHWDGGRRIFDRDYHPASHDRDFRGDRDFDRGHDSDRGRDFDRGHDRDRDRGHDRDSGRDSGRSRGRDRDGRF